MPRPASRSGGCCVAVRRLLHLPTNDAATPRACAPLQSQLASFHSSHLAPPASNPSAADHCPLQMDPECDAHPAQLGVLPNDPDGIVFQNKEFFRPLQAADILAWNMRSFMQDEISRGLPEAPGRIRPYFQVLRKPPMRIGFMRDRDLEKAARDISEYEEREGKPAYKMTRRQFTEWRNRETNK
jgi:hypothetical protein